MFRIAECTSIGKAVRCQEGTAAHARIDVTLQLPHDLGGNVIRNHALRGAFSRQFRQIIVSAVFMDVVFIQNIDQLRERRRDPDALFVLDTLHSAAAASLRCTLQDLPASVLPELHPDTYTQSQTVPVHWSSSA